jgi:hypothetical protein
MALVFAAAALAGCARDPSPAELAELEQVKRDRAAMDASLDHLEARMLESQHRVSMNLELRARHGEVSQVACQNLDDHWAGINRFLDNQREKEKKKRAQRVAAVVRTTDD